MGDLHKIQQLNKIPSFICL